MTTRVYVPVSVADLVALVNEGRLAGPLRAHAVTEELRSSWPEADEDTWEYAALMAAAAASRPTTAGRRRVVAADVRLVEPDPGEDPTTVMLPGDVTWKGVAAAHVDTGDGAHEDDDLAWFASQEIAHLLDGE